MPTDKTRKRAHGSTRYTAVVRMRRGTTVLHQESRTFAHRAAAVSWAKHREVALEDPAAPVRTQHGAPTLAELIGWYIDTFETISRWQRSKQTRLEFLERHFPDIAFSLERQPIPAVGAKQFCGTKPAANHCAARLYDLGLAGFGLNVVGAQCDGD